MKLVTSVFVVSVLAVLGVACEDGGGEGLQIGGGAKGAGGAPSATAESNATAAAAASAKCPAGVPEAKQLVTNPNAADLTIAGGHVFYRSLTKVVRANKDGSAQIDVVESADLIRSHVDGTTLLLVESPTPPTAVLRVYELDAKGAIAGGVAGLQKEGATINTKSNAGGTMVIGSDTESLYIHADEEKAEVIYALGRTKDRTLTEVVRVTEGVMSHPQVANDALWYVIDGKRVFKVDLGAAKGIASKPKEIFGMGYASCGLAVGAGKAFCATGAALEQRDIDGSNVKPVLEKDKSKARTRN